MRLFVAITPPRAVLLEVRTAVDALKRGNPPAVNALLRWTPNGYDTSKRRPRGTMVGLLTPPAIVSVLAAGYRPRWHPSADATSSPP